MANFIKGFIGAILVATGIFIGMRYQKMGNWLGVTDVQTTHRMVLEKVSSLGKLELAKFTFKDIVEQELVREFLPNPKALLIVQGEAIGCLDLTKITAGDINLTADTLVVQLPDPELCSYKIDHQHSKIFQTEFAFMNEQLLLDEAYKRAETQIRAVALESGILEQTKKNAELVLKPLLENASGKKVVLRYNLHARLDRLR